MPRKFRRITGMPIILFYSLIDRNRETRFLPPGGAVILYSFCPLRGYAVAPLPETLMRATTERVEKRTVPPGIPDAAAYENMQKVFI